MADLPRWEYVLIIICAEVILAVIITLVICWKCRWSKKDEFKDEKRPLPMPEVDDVMDDMFKKDDHIVVGHAPLRHEFMYTSKKVAFPDEQDASFTTAPAAYTNFAFANIAHKTTKLNESVTSNTEESDDMKSKDNHTETVVGSAIVYNEKTSRQSKQQALSVASQYTPENVSRQSTTIQNSKRPPTITMGNAIYVVDNQLLTTNHQPSPSISESSRLTPVEFEMNVMNSTGMENSPMIHRHSVQPSSPLVVQSVDAVPIEMEAVMSSQPHTLQTNEWRQFNRELDLLRSPPPSYQSATGRRTNPFMGQPVMLVEADY
ncbi:unnamed protein product [Mytilus coruscus]|uniref:Uncharacterized protein n=1 Tax=Mytilus coruscus TaxID=42192 RepID=A0A6J8D6D6_MYTCO|nr:unnamed protein product [Mytilus coruscus]